MSDSPKRIVSDREIGTINLKKSLVVVGNKFTFGDGTELVIFAKSRTPPIEELTPNDILDPHLPHELRDKGEIEAYELASESDAFQILMRLIEELKNL